VPTLIGCNLLKNFRNQPENSAFLASLLTRQQRRSEIVAAFLSACQHLKKNFFDSLQSDQLAHPTNLLAFAASSEARHYDNTVFGSSIPV